MRITLKTTDAPGYAQLTVSQWKGDTSPQIAVQHVNGKYFVRDDYWQAEESWHTTDFTVENGTIHGTLKPWLIDGMVNESINSPTFIIHLRDEQGHEGSQNVRLPRDLLSSSAAGNASQRDNVYAPPPEETSPPEPVAQEPEHEPEPEPVPPPVFEEPKKKRSILWFIIPLILILLIALAAGLAYYFLHKGMSLFDDLASSQTTSQEAPKEEPKEAPKEAPKETPPTPEAVSECSMSKASDEMTFVQACLKTKPDTQKLLAIIKEAETAKKCTIAQRLYAHEAQNNADIAVAYAQEYENGSDCFKADKDNAIYWYETALATSPDNATAKSHLDALKNK